MKWHGTPAVPYENFRISVGNDLRCSFVPYAATLTHTLPEKLVGSVWQIEIQQAVEMRTKTR